MVSLQLRSASPARAFFAASRVSQSFTNAGLDLGSGTAIPLAHGAGMEVGVGVDVGNGVGVAVGVKVGVGVWVGVSDAVGVGV